MASPTLQRRRLGKLMKRARESAGITQEDAGAAIDAAHTKISRIELGQSGLKLTDLNILLAQYEVEDTLAEKMRELARAGRKRGRWSAYRNAIPTYFRDYLELEEDASLIRWYQAEVAPGVVQDESYVRSMFMTAAARDADDESERQVEMRLARQAVLSRADATLHFIVSESAVRRMVNNAGVMAAQARHMIGVATRPNVQFQMFPFDAQTYAPASYSFTMLQFDHDPGTDVVYLEDFTDAAYRDDQESVGAYNGLWDRLSAAALGPVESLERLRQIADEFERRARKESPP